jgi:two-component system LytT family response regulator
MIRAIIVEDEYHPRMTLKQKIEEKYPDIEIISLCESAESALIEILRLQPELLFLDIQLQGENGLWLAEQMYKLACETFCPPCVIFTTAYTDSEYLLRAFQLAAVDYLVKPIAIDKLEVAIDRFRSKINASSSLGIMMNTFEKENIMRFRSSNGLILLREDDITFVRADGNYSEMGLANGNREDIFERLGEIEAKLPKGNFERFGKSFIINKKYIRRLNFKKNIIQMSTPQITFDIEAPSVVIKLLKKQLEE